MIWLAEEDQWPNLSYATCSSWTKGAPTAPFVGGCLGGNLENGFVASFPLDAAQESGPEYAIHPSAWKGNSAKFKSQILHNRPPTPGYDHYGHDRNALYTRIKAIHA